MGPKYSLPLMPRETAIVISNTKTAISDVTSVHVLALGETLDGASYWVQADSGSVFQEVTLDTLETLDNSGTSLKLKIIITDSDTRIDAIALLYK